MAKYQLQEGDSLYKLAKRYAKSPQDWRAIKEANPELFSKNKKGGKKGIKVGQVITIPKRILTEQGHAEIRAQNKERRTAKKEQRREESYKFADEQLHQDPTWLAYQRWNNLERERLEEQIEFENRQFDDQINRRAQGYETQKTDDRRDIGVSHEDRGLYDASARRMEQTRNDLSIDAARLEDEATARDELERRLRRPQQDLLGLDVELEDQRQQELDRLAQEEINRRAQNKAGGI